MRLLCEVIQIKVLTSFIQVLYSIYKILIWKVMILRVARFWWYLLDDPIQLIQEYF